MIRVLSVTMFLSIILFLFSGCNKKNPVYGEKSTPVEDIDGNVYETVKIGNQVWMAENLKVTHYRNGDPIPNVTNRFEWNDLSNGAYTGAYCVYDNDESYSDTYGYLYNWYAVNDNRNIAPAGWHVPTDEEWKQLEMYLGMSQSEADDTGYRGTNEGSKMAGNAALWNDHDLEQNAAFGKSGLAARPGGCRDLIGNYVDMGDYAYFWSSTANPRGGAWDRELAYHNDSVYRHTGRYSRCGESVRCVRD